MVGLTRHFPPLSQVYSWPSDGGLRIQDTFNSLEIHSDVTFDKSNNSLGEPLELYSPFSVTYIYLNCPER